MTRSRLMRAILFASAALSLNSFSWSAAKAPETWDGLVRVPAKSADLLYLRPGADFSGYNAIMLDPTEVAFRKNWKKDLDRSRVGVRRASDADIRKAIDEAQVKLRSIFEKRFSETGFGIVSTPGENVARVFVGVANVDVAAPEMRTAGRSHSYSQEAGRATVVIDVRDSLSGELLGRVVDHGVAGDHLMTWRDSSSNWGDFEQLFDEWANTSAKGFRKLVASAPTAGK